MKGLKRLRNRKWMAAGMTAFALAFVNIGANMACYWVFHQPEKPDLKKFRKF